MNNVSLIGNLTRDPELRTTPSGTSVSDLRLAINRPKRGGEEQGADYVDVVCWGVTAENCAKYLAKGRPIAVTGRLRHSEWETDGQRRSKLEVVAEQVRLPQRQHPRRDAGPGRGGGRSLSASLPASAPACRHRSLRPESSHDHRPDLHHRRGGRGPSKPRRPNTTSAAGSPRSSRSQQAQLGSGAALTAGRPGSWEAALVDQLIRGTVGHDDEVLSYYDPRQELSQPDGPEPDA